jgi:lysophospholipase L1-like esterase
LTFEGNVVALGNSITAGAGLSGGQDYPSQLRTSLGSTWQVFNSGHSGETTPQLSANFASYVQSHYTAVATRNILVVNEVGNDLIGGASEATALANMRALIAQGRAAGWRVYFATTTPRTVPNFTAGQQTAASNINAFFRNNASERDGLIDWAANANLSDPANLTYYQDGVHPTAAGAVILASLVFSAL